MQYMIQDFLLGGYSQSMYAKRLRSGFDSELAQRINKGNFFSGTSYTVSGQVTPSFNDQTGELST